MIDDLTRILNEVPDYQCFLTVDELNQSSIQLAQANPDIVERFEFGKSRSGDAIIGLKIGNGSKNALVFGFPHPNEPIGSMTAEYLSKVLVENEALRASLDYTWYIIKVWDSDGAKLNEAWFKGPFTIYNYARNFFRPAGYEQVDWTFPINYKNMHFDNSLPEATAMMALIDRIQPTFIYSLHNAGFGGAYWYLSKDLPQVYDALYKAAERQNIPLHLGEPEVPFCRPLADAIYPLINIREHYDYLEQYGLENPQQALECGTSSADYAEQKYGSFTLLTELPYFFNDTILDKSDSGQQKGALYKAMILDRQKIEKFITASLEQSAHLMAKDNPFLLALKAFTGRQEEDEAAIKMADTDPNYQINATVGEAFDMQWIAKFYNLLLIGLVLRANETELANCSEEAKKIFTTERDKGLVYLKEQTEYLEANFKTEVIDIKRLVSMQLECGLIVAKYLSGKA